MFFSCVEGAFDPVTLEQAAALMDASQPHARARLSSLVSIDNSLICIGRENNVTLALAAGVVERGVRHPVFFLQELVIAQVRRRCGIGEELLAFAILQAKHRGAWEVMASEHLVEKGRSFLLAQRFADGVARDRMSRPIK